MAGITVKSLRKWSVAVGQVIDSDGLRVIVRESTRPSGVYTILLSSDAKLGEDEELFSSDDIEVTTIDREQARALHPERWEAIHRRYPEID
jgi:hypothetical protein